MKNALNLSLYAKSTIISDSTSLVLGTTILVDSDYAHDKKTRRSLTDWIAIVGSTPVACQSKHDGSVAFSIVLMLQNLMQCV